MASLKSRLEALCAELDVADAGRLSIVAKCQKCCTVAGIAFEDLAKTTKRLEFEILGVAEAPAPAAAPTPAPTAGAGRGAAYAAVAAALSSANDGDVVLTSVQSSADRAAASLAQAERNGDILDLMDDDETSQSIDDESSATNSATGPRPLWYVKNQHLPERRRMITDIANLLKAKKPLSLQSAEWMQKLPQMARRLEESMFRSALSFDDYRDRQTLKKRLQALAIAMGLRAQRQATERAKQQQANQPQGAPPREPLKGFMLFAKEKRPEVKRDYPGLTFGGIGKKLGELWRGLSDAERAKYK